MEEEEDKDVTNVKADEDLKEVADKVEEDGLHPSPVPGSLDSSNDPSRYLTRGRSKHSTTKSSDNCIQKIVREVFHAKEF